MLSLPTERLARAIMSIHNAPGDSEQPSLHDNESKSVNDVGAVARQRQILLVPSSTESLRSDDIALVGKEQTPKSKENTNMQSEYPDGGLEAWLVVLGAWCVQFMVFGIANSTAGFQEYVSNHILRGTAPVALGILFSIPLSLTFFLGLFVGPVFDAHGARLLVLSGTTAIVLSMFIMSIATEYWHFLVGFSILSGLGGSMLCVPSYASIGHYFSRRQGLATGIATTGGSIGGIVLPVALNFGIPNLGWPWTVRLIAFILLALALVANACIRTRLPPTRHPIRLIPDMSPLRDVKFAICVLGMFLLEWGIFVPDAYISSYITATGGTQTLAFLSLSAMNLAGLFGRVIPGYISDIIGPCTVLTLTIALSAGAVLGLWLPAGHSLGMIIAFAVVFGFGVGGNLGLIPVCALKVAPRKVKGEEESTGLAAAYALQSFATLTSLPLAGAILQASGGRYMGMILFSGASYAVAAVCFAVARVMAVGWGLKRVY